MERLYYESFIQGSYGEEVYAISVKDGEIYTKAWVEEWPDASRRIPEGVNEPFRILSTSVSEGIALDKGTIVCEKSMFKVIMEAEDYNNPLYYHYETDRTDFESVYDCLCSFVKPYSNHGKVDSNDYDIFKMTFEEFQSIYDALRDGDYIFVIED